MKQILFKNTNISYSDTGKGTAIVLLHGFLENKGMWDFYIPEFAKKNRIITIDLLGHGETECLSYVQTMEDNADAVHAVLSELRIRKAIFVGHSMGGYVALAFAELYPDTIKGLVLLNSTARADSEERKTNRDRAIKAVKQSFVNFISLSIANLFSENNRERLLSVIESVKKEALKTPLQGIVASLEGMKIRQDREVLLHLAPFPKLLILGEKDPVLNYEETKEQIEGTAMKLVTFPDGHMSHIENQDELLNVLLAFFKSI
ncbi:alpha/beta hydrolase [Flavobacterium sp. RSP49]|uniref:Alpha/beta hydrolase n=1 Tax=Flavobacterium bomense TaxID=2497483 RepID=A0A3S0Q7A0_9FLAO|nr:MULTISPECIES: alpha/beta hydrolase [Flavobacterium]RTY86691.1 alpha/beta hydrolase [Flavobacterium sp. RSP15]RTY90436.1 alpha/beta hydrolase [Flavobacterium sp. RSP46]RTZ01644.1 alpha/beta hydrolase [Flavobacterium sp. RSP49]RTZ03012.1 alpha/beta hydrolase [Flavobacterium bomense]